MINRACNPCDNVQTSALIEDCRKRTQDEVNYKKIYTLDNGKEVVYFHSSNIDIVRVDFLYPNNNNSDWQPLKALMANKMITEGTSKHTSQEIAEILDSRGVYIDKTVDVTSANVSVMMLKKHVDYILPLLYDMLTDAQFPENEYNVILNKTKQNFLNQMMKNAYVARREFYKAIFGEQHPCGRFIEEADFAALAIEDLKAIYRNTYALEKCEIFLSGNITDDVLKTMNAVFGSCRLGASSEVVSFPEKAIYVPQKRYIERPDSVQSTVRIGKFETDDSLQNDVVTLSELTIANTVLGGYFGSKLIKNVREDKGYCYSIHSMLEYRKDCSIFFITTDVGKEVKDNAAEEIYKELDDLCTKPISQEELAVVKNYLVGDFIRNIDGVFEVAERCKLMSISGFPTNFNSVYLDTLENITPQRICEVANKYLSKETMSQIIVG